jgi:hypothetical protein
MQGRLGFMLICSINFVVACVPAGRPDFCWRCVHCEDCSEPPNIDMEHDKPQWRFERVVSASAQHQEEVTAHRCAHPTTDERTGRSMEKWRWSTTIRSSERERPTVVCHYFFPFLCSERV